MSHRYSAARSATVAMVLAGCLMGWPGDSPSSRYEFTTVAKLDQPAPKVGTLIAGFEHVAINNQCNLNYARA